MPEANVVTQRELDIHMTNFSNRLSGVEAKMDRLVDNVTGQAKEFVQSLAQLQSPLTLLENNFKTLTKQYDQIIVRQNNHEERLDKHEKLVEEVPTLVERVSKISDDLSRFKVYLALISSTAALIGGIVAALAVSLLQRELGL